jgi:hypothetical protein
VLLVERRADGSFDTLPSPGEPVAASGTLADVVPPGSVAAVALIEHTRATPLRSAVQRAGGALVEEAWLAPDDLAVLDDLAAQRQGW